MGLCCGGEGWGVSVGRRKSSAIQSLSTQRKGLAELVSYNSVTIPLFIDQLKLLVWHRTVSDFCIEVMYTVSLYCRIKPEKAWWTNGGI